jgi:hypothetical protein
MMLPEDHLPPALLPSQLLHVLLLPLLLQAPG